jgi:hypothetical protein
MQPTTYELLNPNHFTHLVAKDSDVVFSYKSPLYYQLTFFYFVKILKFHVINFQCFMIYKVYNDL